MKIMVYDVAAQGGGGMTVLLDFYREVLEKSPGDIQWCFAVSQPGLEEAPGVRVLRFAKPKRSPLHRLIFEHWDFPRLLRREMPDVLISLQNMPVARYRGRQLVLLHQSLQFCPRTFSFRKPEERELALRQRVICRIIRRTLPRAEHLFVQTQWIKDACIPWLGWPEDRITVVRPRAIPPAPAPYTGVNSRTFFYPASGDIYKNHPLVIDACRILEREGIRDYRVIFTLSPGDGPWVEGLIRSARGLPIEFVGSLPHEQVWQTYSRSILLFPSYLETCGLPLVEARAAGSWILASDLPFAREALAGYPNRSLFDHRSPQALAQEMKRVLAGVPWQAPGPAEPGGAPGLMEAMLETINRGSTK